MIIIIHTKPLLASNGNKGYGVLISKCCCFYYLEAKVSPELAMDAGYCLVQVESTLSFQRNELYFAATYFLDTCLRVWIYKCMHDIVQSYSNSHAYAEFGGAVSA